MADTPEDRLALARVQARLVQPSLHLKQASRQLRRLRESLTVPLYADQEQCLDGLATSLERAGDGLELIEARLDRLEGHR